MQNLESQTKSIMVFSKVSYSCWILKLGSHLITCMFGHNIYCFARKYAQVGCKLPF